ncbi:hypothetical protein VTK73DRAFT_4005 [Phialemonium thermophilum]|uniref:Uncharacterized protein n=1 Tax=Phialemonium thermophilum TaxID=223376 RepID=A0ABR3VCJ7_9PEZI
MLPLSFSSDRFFPGHRRHQSRPRSRRAAQPPAPGADLPGERPLGLGLADELPRLHHPRAGRHRAQVRPGPGEPARPQEDARGARRHPRRHRAPDLPEHQRHPGLPAPLPDPRRDHQLHAPRAAGVGQPLRLLRGRLQHLPALHRQPAQGRADREPGLRQDPGRRPPRRLRLQHPGRLPAQAHAALGQVSAAPQGEHRAARLTTHPLISDSPIHLQIGQVLCLC